MAAHDPLEIRRHCEPTGDALDEDLARLVAGLLVRYLTNGLDGEDLRGGGNAQTSEAHAHAADAR